MRKSRGVAHARQRIKSELGWLRGFPERTAQGWQWFALPKPPAGGAEPIALDGALLSRATRATKVLLRDERAALSLAVGDPVAWHARTLAILAALKPALHARGAPDLEQAVAATLPVRMARKLAAVTKRAPALAAPLAWIHLSDARALSKVLDWLDTHVAELERLRQTRGVIVVALLAELWLLEGARVDALMELMCSPGGHSVPLRAPDNVAQAVAKRRRGASATWPATPAARLDAACDEMLSSWCRATARERRRGLELLALVTPISWVERWARWWSEHDALVANAKRLFDAGPLSPAASKRISAIVRALDKLDGKRPAAIDEPLLVRALAQVSAASDAAFIALLRATPIEIDARPVRLSVLLLIAHNLATPDVGAAGTARWARELSRFIAARRNAKTALRILERYWRHDHLPGGRAHWLVELDLLEGDEPREAIARYYRALSFWYSEQANERAAAKAWSETSMASILAIFARHDIGPTEAARLTSAIAATGIYGGMRWIDATPVQIALSLCPTREPERVAALATALHKADAHGFDDNDDRLGVKGATSEPGAATLLADMVLGGQVRLVIALGGRVRLLAAIGAPPIALNVDDASDAPWIARYTPALSPLLSRLAAVDPQAPRSAAQLLGKAFADPEALRTELRALRERIAGDTANQRLVQRATNLERRIREPPSISAQKLARLSAKLDALWRLRLVERWQQRLDDALSRSLGPMLFGSHAPLPPWLLASPCDKILPHALALDARQRKVAVRVLVARAGPQPWDLRDAPPNRGFVERLERLGIDMTPWLDGIGVHAFDTARGQLFAQLERDPLEVMMMGEHFGTCLSLGQFNFFSTITNAADINKRVLFARDDAGQVVGRSLFGLSADGLLLCFHPYAHDARWAYPELARVFALRLAERMGTELGSSGELPVLVAADWYDDGPIDQAGRFEALREGSALHDALAHVSPAALPALLDQALSPVGLNAVTVPLVVGLAPLRARPDLAVALLETVQALKLPHDSKVAVATLALQGGALDTVRRYVDHAILPGLERRFDRRRPPDSDTVELLLALDEASLVTRLLVRSRPRGTRSWVGELNLFRLWFAARAHQSLHRRRLAVSLYERVQQMCPAQLSMHAHASEQLALLRG